MQPGKVHVFGPPELEHLRPGERLCLTPPDPEYAVEVVFHCDVAQLPNDEFVCCECGESTLDLELGLNTAN